jgi:hypothetical protein
MPSRICTSTSCRSRRCACRGQTGRKFSTAPACTLARRRNTRTRTPPIRSRWSSVDFRFFASIVPKPMYAPYQSSSSSQSPSSPQPSSSQTRSFPAVPNAIKRYSKRRKRPKTSHAPAIVGAWSLPLSTPSGKRRRKAARASNKSHPMSLTRSLMRSIARNA